MIPDDAPLGLPHEALRAWAVVLMGVCAAGCLALAFVSPRAGRDRSPRVPPWLLVGAGALALRAAMSLVQDGAVFDVLVSYRSIGDRVLQGADIWSGSTESLATYPPPVYGWWAIAALVPGGDPHVFAAVVRAPFWAVDAGLAALLVRLVPGPAGVRAGWIYALAPAVVAVPTLHGQHDPVTDALLVGGVVLLQRGRSTVQAGILAGLATALKQWPLFFVLPLLAAVPRRRAPILLACTIAPLLLAFALYGLTHPHDAARGVVDVATYRPHREGLGSSLLFSGTVDAGVIVAANVAVTLAAGVLAAVMVVRGRSLADAMAVDMLLLVGLSPTVSDQYLMWAFPFLLLAGRLRTAALLGAGLLPAVVSLDLWQTVNDGDAPRGLLVLASASCVVAAVWVLATARADPRPSRASDGRPHT